MSHQRKQRHLATGLVKLLGYQGEGLGTHHVEINSSPYGSHHHSGAIESGCCSTRKIALSTIGTLPGLTTGSVFQIACGGARLRKSIHHENISVHVQAEHHQPAQC